MCAPPTKASIEARGEPNKRGGFPQRNTYLHDFRHAMTSEASPGDDQANIYVGTSSGEIFYSRPSGDSWELLHAHLPAVVSLEASIV